MRAMILAAGHGERMRPLTDHTPKPLLEVNGKPLIVYHLERLAACGITDIVINHGRLGQLIENRLGDGSLFGVNIQYSAEGEAPLETGGGIYQALPLLGREAFIALNADIWTDYDFNSLPRAIDGLGHLVLVPNPKHNQNGDFALENSSVRNTGTNQFTFSGIGLYRPELFASASAGRYSLTPLLRVAADQQQLSGVVYEGVWSDIGTPERLSEIQSQQSE